MSRWKCAALAILAGVAQAQIQEHGLIAGHVLDSRNGTIRAVRGIPGAARLGDPIPFGDRIAEAAVRNGRAIVITAAEESKVYLLRHLDAPTPEVIPIDSAVAPFSRVYLNGSATAALLYSGATGTTQFVTDLDGDPKVSDPIPASAVSGKFLDGAVAETRNCALLASFDDEAGYVQHVCAGSGSEVTLIARLPGVRPAAVSWFQRDRDALVADAARNELLWLPQFATGAAPAVLAGPDDGIEDPAALLAVGGTTVGVVNRGSSSLILADTRQIGVAKRVRLPEVPTRIEFLDGSSTLAMTRIGPGPLLLVDPLRDFAAAYVPMN